MNQILVAISRLEEVIDTGNYPDIDPNVSMSEAGRQLIQERNEVARISIRAFQIAAGLTNPVINLPGDCSLPLLPIHRGEQVKGSPSESY